MNYVNPDIRNMPWTDAEDNLLERKHAELGPKWTAIAGFFPGRSKNNVINRWKWKLRKLNKGKPKEKAATQDVAPETLPVDPDPEDLNLTDVWEDAWEEVSEDVWNTDSD
jgi:hypothetical protein